MPLKPREMEKIIFADGYSRIKTIPFHQGKELNKKTENSIRKQAGLR